jgi:hypothetical protein
MSQIARCQILKAQEIVLENPFHRIWSGSPAVFTWGFFVALLLLADKPLKCAMAVSFAYLTAERSVPFGHVSQRCITSEIES